MLKGCAMMKAFVDVVAWKESCVKPYVTCVFFFNIETLKGSYVYVKVYVHV